MRVLVVGGGGREHALAAALRASPTVEAVFVAPGNPGTAQVATNVAIGATETASLVAWAREERIDLVVPGPEVALVAGIADACASAGIPCAGPTMAASRLESSKTFAREIADEAGIPGPRWEAFSEPAAARDFVRRRGAPIVVKADGLASGKGVVVAATVEEAELAIDTLMTEAADGTRARVVIEECLVGDEVSLFALCDGADAMLLGAAQDHKRIGDGDRGPNTGGMGAVSPPRGFDRDRQEAALAVFIRPVLDVMARRGTPFTGVLFAGLMLTEAGARLVEYNVRLGDPEAQCLLPLLETDLAPALLAASGGNLAASDWRLADAASAAIVLAAPGYPAAPHTGERIGGIEKATALEGVAVFHAGTATVADDDGAPGLVSAGGRVLTVQARAPDLATACALAYRAVGRIDWPTARYRRDIGARSL